MYKFLLIALFVSSFTFAQNKKPLPKKNNTVASVADSSKGEDSVEVREPLPKEFKVYSKKAKIKKNKERLKLCINLLNGDSIFNYCINDSICRDPEVFKILFEQKNADSAFVLVYVRAFSKPADKPACDAGKEVKLFFVRLNTTTNKGIVQIKTIESCMKNITNMTTESNDDWDASSPLIYKYYAGATKFLEVKFDPEHYKLGLQSASDL